MRCQPDYICLKDPLKRTRKVDEEDLDFLLDTSAGLKAFRPFVDMACNAPWFRTIGEEPGRQQVRLAELYAVDMGFPDAMPAFLGDWQEVSEAVLAHDYNSPAWEAEEQIRAGLAADLVELVGEDVATMLMTYLSEQLAPHLEEAAAEAAEHLRIDDEGFVTAMVGAGVQAAHMAAMVILCEREDNHPSARKYALFEEGRWPIGIIGNSVMVF